MVVKAGFWKRLKRSTRGNALMIVGLGMPVLIGGAGFAIDTGQWYMWQRELQHAADQAAYAGAWARAYEKSSGNYKIRALQEYRANVAVVEEFDSNPNIRLADYAGGTDNSVLVSATATKSLPFSSFLTGKAATIQVSAQAAFAEGMNYNACLVSLTDDGTGTSIGGSAVVKANCGIAALSCDEDAITIDGSAQVTTEVIVACGTIDAEDNDDVVVEGVHGLEDIYSELEPPDNDVDREYKCSGNGQNKQASLLPGTYAGLVTKCTTVLASGIYVIDGGTLDLTGNYSVTGNGVMFVLKNGAQLKLGGSGNGNKLNLSPMTAADFIGTPYAAQADQLSDILIFEHRDNNPSSDHVMNGNSDSIIEGLIYLPDGNLQVNGTADVNAQCLQISAWTIDIRGGAFLETLCPSDKSTEVGSAVASVKLVA
jgi:hypothetical protein